MANYKPHLSLQQISTVAIAASAWKVPPVINGIKKFFEKNIDMFNPNQHGYHANDSRNDWTEVKTMAKNYLGGTRLPTALKANLISTVGVLGVRIHHFLEETVVKLFFCGRSASLHEDIEYYARNIQWTPFGTIDTVGVFMQRYNDETIENDLFMWYESCVYCLDKCVLSLWPRDYKRYNIKVFHVHEKTFVLTGYWQNRVQDCARDLLEDFTYRERFELYLPRSSDLENITLISVALGLTEAVKYFWRQLNSQQQQENLPSIFDILRKSKILNSHYLARYLWSVKECYNDILAFIIGELVDEQIQLLSDSVSYVLPMLLKWPWCNLFLPVLDQIWDLLNNDSYRYLVNRFIDVTSYEDTTGWSYGDQNMLIYMWKKLPISFKENISVTDIDFQCSALSSPSAVQFILADPHVHLTPVDILRPCHCILIVRLEEEDYEQVDTWIGKICRNETEREECVNSINVTAACTTFLMEHKYEKIERLFQWRFRGNVEEIKLFKKTLISDKFCFVEMIENVCTEMWETDNVNCKKTIINYIKWFTDCSDEKLTTELLKINDHWCQIFTNLCYHLLFNICENIFSCYSLTGEEIEVLKKYIFWKFLLRDPADMMDASYDDDVGVNFHWACDTFDKKCDFFNTFLESQDAEVYFTNIASVNLDDEIKIRFFEEMTANWFGASSREEITNFAERLRTRWRTQNSSEALLRNFDLFLMYLESTADD